MGNPIEVFLNDLLSLLQKHEEETGARIILIEVGRFSAMVAGDQREALPISEIKLKMV